MSSEEISYIIQYDFDTKNHNEEIDTIEELLEKMKQGVPNIKILSDKLINKQHTKIAIPIQYKLFRLSDFVLSAKDRKNIFEPIIADWHEELFEALNNKQIWKARWISFRYTYAFFVTMWQRVSICKLVEMNSKTFSSPKMSQETVKDLFIEQGLSVENQYVPSSIKLSKKERERLAEVFSSSQQLGELISEDREER